ncbi:MAG: recombinase family protein [Clostridium sp.]
MVTKAQLEEKIKELQEDNKKLDIKNNELEKEKELSYQKVTDLKFQISHITNDQVQERYKDTLKYYKKLIKELSEKVEKLENERKLILGRKPFEDNKVIELMYKLYLENNSFNEIANYLNERNIYTRRGGSWSKSSVSLILKKEENMRTYLKTEEEFKKFFELIENNKRNKKQ